MNYQKLGLLLLILVPALAAYALLDAHHLLTLEAIKSQHERLMAFRHEHALLTMTAILLAYLMIGTLPLPVAALTAVLCGALFGLIGGFLLISFASTVGAACGFGLSRYLLRAPLSQRYAAQAQRINEGVSRDGDLFLLSLRLVPVLPFFLVNLLFGLTSMPLRRFYVLSQIGMAPGALLFANAGRELSKLDSLHDLLSPGLIASLVLIASLPWMARAALRPLRRRKSA